MQLISDMSDEELGQTIENCCNCGDAAGGYAAEAWERYKNKKKECEELEKSKRDLGERLVRRLNQAKDRIAKAVDCLIP